MTSAVPSARPSRLAAAVLQLVLVLLVLGAIAAAVIHVLESQRTRGIQSGFGFLRDPAGFSLGETWLSFEPSQPFWRAFAAGLANTLRVAVPAALMAVVLGTLLGLGRLVPHRLLRACCTLVVESIRNVPLLVHLLLTYFALTELLPPPAEAWSLGESVWLSKSGLSLPWPASAEGQGWPTHWDWPQRNAFNISGGAALTPEYLAVALALTAYSASFVAEIVRAGVQSVSLGQLDAAKAMGFTPLQQLRYVVMPQALRLIVPPLTNQLLSLTKNSSLAVAIGYPELVSVANTTLNQTGRSFECITIIMAVYLSLSLLTAAAMQVFNARIALRGAAPA